MRSQLPLRTRYEVPDGVAAELSDADRRLLECEGVPMVPGTYLFAPLDRLDTALVKGALLFAGHPACGFIGIDLASGEIGFWDSDGHLRHFVNSTLRQYCASLLRFYRDLPYDSTDDEYPYDLERLARELRTDIEMIDDRAILETSLWFGVSDDIEISAWTSEELARPYE